EIVKIGEQYWMAENLRYLPQVDGADTSLIQPKYYVYNYTGTEIEAAKTTANYETYGALYNWLAALTACPAGWHLPTSAEWDILVESVGNEAATKLKATSVWPSGDKTDEFGFGALPGGRFDNGKFVTLLNNGHWWTSTMQKSSQADIKSMAWNLNYLSTIPNEKHKAYSLRCIAGEVDFTDFNFIDKSLKLKVNSEFNLIVSYTPTNATLRNLSWLSSDKSVATVDANGKIKALKAGTTVIRATAESGKVEECEVTVLIPVESVSFAEQTIEMYLGQDSNQIATVLPKNSADQSLLWTSSNENVAIVDENGKITSIKPGKSTISAIAENGVKAECDVLVKYEFLDQRDNNIYPLVEIDSQLWMAENLRYLPSLNDAVSEASIPMYYVYDYKDKDVDSAKNTDNYKTYGTLYNWLAALSACPAGWHLSTNDEWSVLIDYVEDNTGTKLKSKDGWERDSGVDEYGFKAMPGGFYSNEEFSTEGFYGYWWGAEDSDMSKAYAHYIDEVQYGITKEGAKDAGFSVRCVAGEVELEEIKLANEFIKIELGNEHVLEVSYFPTSATNKTLTWTSSDESVATVDKNGKIKTLNAGTTTITAVSENGKLAECEVSVIVFAESITLSEDFIKLAFRQETTLVATILPENTTENTLTWTSSNIYIAPVDQNGKVTVFGAGHAVITATTENGKKAECMVQVVKKHEFIDQRDNYAYTMVHIGDQLWMAENLRYLPQVNGFEYYENHSMDTPKYYVFYHDNDNVSDAKATSEYQTYGALYNWQAALTACPAGWHLPTEEEWNILYNYIGSGAKDKLKSDNLWDGYANGTDDYGFSALPGGYYIVERSGYGIFGYEFQDARWWGGTEKNLLESYGQIINSTITPSSNIGKHHGLAVRCVAGEVPLSHIKLASDVFKMKLNSEHLMKVSYVPINTTSSRNITWSSSNKSVATIDKNGKVKSLKTGKTIITATAENGSKAECEVEVMQKLEFLDKRDNHTYKIVQIEDQIWMGENLRYLPEVNGVSINTANPRYYVYDYKGTDVTAAKNTSNYRDYGAMYNYPAAINACPAGLRLPTNHDWTNLMDIAGGSSVAGLKLNATSGWSYGNDGTDEYGFSALPSGYFSAGAFSQVLINAYWWSAQDSTAGPYYWRILGGDGYGYRMGYSDINKSDAFAVRCIAGKDKTASD
ncbi:MAG: hypothetical protein GX801_03215, partial [Fibrobacter sp.]|nr:hypothetical protein [Fibrobacter sp.]